MGSPKRTNSPANPNTSRYGRFDQINGSHPLKSAVPDSHIAYQAFQKKDGEVYYFNFDLAKEMRLIDKDHPPVINKNLASKILETFSLEIINEYDQTNKRKVDSNLVKPDTYMATRYLQLQHPNKQGKTSGDGRSIWNGYFKNKNETWDISSCGTGATSLSPATAIEGKYFKTGDKYVSYGCGKSYVSEGLAAAINSEIFHYNGIETERTLAIIKFKDGTSINIRAARNLLRPAHLFRYLKQGDYANLKSIVDYYVKRETDNGNWPVLNNEEASYRYLLEKVTNCFAQLAAKFESEYIFCWMDWDGDNIMMNGGIIDFGSIRQLGLFHREYRYDDVERMSTTISGQKHQAKYIVQTFAQLVDFLITKKKKNIKLFRNHKSIKDFNKTFMEARHAKLLYRIGFDNRQTAYLMNDRDFKINLQLFMKFFNHFEQTQAGYGIYEVSDGITSDAVFCMRDLLREIPMRYLEINNDMISAEEFIDIARSDYARDNDIRLFPSRKNKIDMFQHYYNELISIAARSENTSRSKILQKLVKRSSLINRFDRVTGDSILFITDHMMKLNKKLGANEMYRVIRQLITKETLWPESPLFNSSPPQPLSRTDSKKALAKMLTIVKRSRSGL